MENHLLLYKKKRWILSCIEWPAPIWASNERISKKKEGRKTRWQKMTAFIFLRQPPRPNWRVLRARKNAGCSRTTGDGWWSVRIGNERCNCLRPRATRCNELFCRVERKEWRSVKKKGEKNMEKASVFLNRGRERIACVSSFRFFLFLPLNNLVVVVEITTRWMLRIRKVGKKFEWNLMLRLCKCKLWFNFLRFGRFRNNIKIFSPIYRMKQSIQTNWINKFVKKKENNSQLDLFYIIFHPEIISDTKTILDFQKYILKKKETIDQMFEIIP